MATSPTIFAEAAPLIFSKPLLFVYTRLDKHDNLLNDFNARLERTFVHDSAGTLPSARELVRRMAITIRFPKFYANLSDLHERLPCYFSSISAFTTLRELHISLGPECLPGNRETFEEYVAMTDMSQVPLGVQRLAYSPFLSKLSLTVDALRCIMPKDCNVVWRFDKAGMPCIPPNITERTKVMDHLKAVNCIMGVLWKDSIQTVSEA